MLAQWVSWTYREGYERARREPLITLGSAPLEVPEFRAVVLGQLGESKLISAIETDIAAQHSHARALDADTKGPLKDIHRRVATTILFESSGGQVDKIAHLPELRFALGEPEIDTTSIDNAAYALEAKAFFISAVGSDGYKIYHKATIRKAVSDRRASLDEVAEIKPTMRNLVRKEWDRGATMSIEPFPEDGAAVPDSPRLSLALMDPETEWTSAGTVRERIVEWCRIRGKSPRLYPGSIVWCFRKAGRELREKVEIMLAWKKVAKDVADGVLGTDYDRPERTEIAGKVSGAEEDAKDEVWASYRFIVLTDSKEPDGLKVIDLGAGHSSAQETLCGRVIQALKSSALLNDSVGAGYLDRNWPPALKESGAWPLSSLRQSFLNGSLTRLLDPDAVLKAKIVEFVNKGDFGLTSGSRSDGSYDRIWFEELISPDEVTFDANVFLITKNKGKALRSWSEGPQSTENLPKPEDKQPPGAEQPLEPKKQPESQTVTLNLRGSVPPEIWNRLGTKLIPKLRSGNELTAQVNFSVTLDGKTVGSFESELRQILEDLGLADKIRVEKS
jgi:hypothetical protein